MTILQTTTTTTDPTDDVELIIGEHNHDDHHPTAVPLELEERRQRPSMPSAPFESQSSPTANGDNNNDDNTKDINNYPPGAVAVLVTIDIEQPITTTTAPAVDAIPLVTAVIVIPNEPTLREDGFGLRRQNNHHHQLKMELVG